MKLPPLLVVFEVDFMCKHLPSFFHLQLEELHDWVREVAIECSECERFWQDENAVNSGGVEPSLHRAVPVV